MYAGTEGVQRVRRWLYRYSEWIHELQNKPAQRPVIGILLRGLTTSADHMASAHLERMPRTCTRTVAHARADSQPSA